MKAKILSLAKARKAAAQSAREATIARVAAHLDLLELNEFNFVVPEGGGLDIHEPGRAWWHRVSAVFGMPRFPESEAELLGTQQNLMFLVMAARPVPSFPEQDESWLAAGRATIEKATPWASAWFEAYLAQDLAAMREAMVEDEFIDCAAKDWLEIQAAQAAAVMKC